MSAIKYVTYDTITGEVMRNSSASASAYDRLPTTSPAGQSRYVGELGGSGFNRYMPNGVPTDRPEFALTITGSTITGVPVGTSVVLTDPEFNETTYTIDDGEIDLTGSSTGTYQLRLTNFPYQDKTIEVTV